MPVSAPLADLLADRRAGLNARVAMARSRQPNLDTAALSAFLRDPVDPLLGHVLRERPDGGAAGGSKKEGQWFCSGLAITRLQ